MNDHAIIDIQKHNNKINRILNKIYEKSPEFAQEIDLALYSCLKIDKIIKKHLQNNPIKTVQNERKIIFVNRKVNEFQSEEDQLYENAINTIEGFKMATKKLENKVSVLLRQQSINRKTQRTKYNNEIEPYYQVSKNQAGSNNCTIKGKKKKHIPTYEDISPFSPHIGGFSQSKSKKNNYNSTDSKNKSFKSKHHKKTHQQCMNESQSFQELQDDSSKSITQINQEIIDLTNKITYAIKRQE